MATHTLSLPVPGRNLEEFIEMLRGFGAVETLELTVEASTREAAVREITANLEEFEATYNGTWLSDELREHVAEETMLVAESSAE